MIAIVTEVILRVGEVARVDSIAAEHAGRRVHRVDAGDLLLLFIVIRPPTLVVAQSIYHRVGGFGNRPRHPSIGKGNTESGETDAEAEIERRCDDDRRLRHKTLSGTVDLGRRGRVERGLVPLFVEAVELEADLKPVGAQTLAFEFRADPSEALDQ